MRVIKDNTAAFESFYKTIPYIQNNLNNTKEFSGQDITKITNYFDKVFSFQNEIKNAASINSVLEIFNDTLKYIINYKEAGIFIFNENKTELKPLNKEISEYSTEFINKAYSEGIIDWIFESSRHKFIPDFKIYNIKGSKLNYLVYPVMSSKHKRGLLYLLTPVATLEHSSLDDKMIETILEIASQKIEILKSQVDFQKSYNDLQLYQSKLINDFKLAAIGELTVGIVDEILTPLQVVLSLTDFNEKENNILTKSDAQSIKNQIKKVNVIIERLVKFAGIKNDNIKIYPCSLNNLIAEYYSLIKSTLDNNNRECILDLGKNVPKILTNPNYINQILSNTFGVINLLKKDSVGIIIQTRFSEGKINLRFAVTEVIEDLKNKNDKSYFNLKFINNLMKKHEGELKINISHRNGTILLMTFPLKRKLR